MGQKADVTNPQRMLVLQFLLESCKNGRPPRGKIAEAAALYNIGRQSVQRIWKTARAQRARSEVISVEKKKRNRKLKHVINYAQIEAIEVQKRGTLQSISDAIGVPKTTVGRWAKNHLLRPHTNAIRPLLKPENMLTRLAFSLQSLQFNSALNRAHFKPMENTIHIDEKWYYLSRKSCRYYLTPMEADPLRVCQSKNFIPKVMFMCAASRPVFHVDGSVLFDGKIGIWPFVQEVTAQRDSIHRKKGTKQIKPVQSITRQVIKDCIIKQVQCLYFHLCIACKLEVQLLNQYDNECNEFCPQQRQTCRTDVVYTFQILPTIKLKWPQCLSKNIMIQQDNARTHINNTDSDFQQIANTDGFHINMIQQPPNSPECNVNDLGFFVLFKPYNRGKNAELQMIL